MGNAQLQDKHRLALKLLAEAQLSRDEIAQSCGMSKETLSNLCNGNTAACGRLAQVFKTEYQKIVSKQTEEYKKLYKENKALVMTKLNQRLRNLLPFKPTKDMTTELVSILNALSKSDQTMHVTGELHATYRMSSDERINEFKRLLAALGQDQITRLSRRGRDQSLN